MRIANFLRYFCAHTSNGLENLTRSFLLPMRPRKRTSKRLFRLECLEARAMLSATALDDGGPLANGASGFFGSATVGP